MALGDLFAQAKRKASKMYNQFFFDEEAPAPDTQRREAYPPQAQQPYPQGDAAYQQPQVQTAYQSPYQQAYQQPQQAAYQQPQQAAYQQPQQPQQAQQPQFSAQYQPPQRNRRAQQHAAQPDNVVPISAYQQAHQAQQAGYQQPQQTPYQQPQQQQAGYQQQPQQAAYQQPQQAQQPQQTPYQQPQQAAATGAARIINARGIGDCRSAIMLLRAGDAVVIVMDGITDPAEMRRYVDTLSGACFSLSATITKVSRYGAYFLAPQGMAVYADQATSQMNGAARPQAQQRPAYPPQQAYGQPQQAYAQPRAAYQPPVNPYPPVRADSPAGDFDQRVAEQAPRQPFYPREAQQAPQTTFAEQPQGYGYAPDESLEAAQN